MGSSAAATRPHAVFLPYPAQGHIKPMMKLAKLLHSIGGFHISFVNTHFNHARLLRSNRILDGLPGFRFYSIPDGLPPSNPDATQSIPALCESTPKHCPGPLADLIEELNSRGSSCPDAPPVSCVVADGAMSFALKVAGRFGIPAVAFWTTSACGLLGYSQYRDLIDRGLVPLKDMSQVTNGFFETTLDWVLGMKDIRLRDFPSFIRTADPDDIMLNFLLSEIKAVPESRALILNTFDALEHPSVRALHALQPNIYTVGPLHLLLDHVQDVEVRSIGSSLWKEDESCIGWLDSREPGSVVYVNYGSITVMTRDQLTEFAWGLAGSGSDFLWVIRSDIVSGESAMLPPEFLKETRGRGMLAGWCKQEEVLKHPAVGAFLTHSGWNSTLESVSAGVPVICWPFFAEQQTNCRYSCVEWGIGMEIDTDVWREKVEAMVRELMGSGGEKGKEMKRKAAEWKEEAAATAAVGGSSYVNLKKLISEVLLGK